MILLENLTKVFRTDAVETTALNGIHFSATKSDFIAITGPSGCGKSTLLNILGLLDRATSGQYFLDGLATAQRGEAERTRLRQGRIGFVFQNFNLIDELTVAENVELPLLYLGLGAAERRRRAGEVLERLAMGHRAGHFPQQLSGGQQQRVAIARAVVAAPRLILADEPTGNLDSVHGREVMDLLCQLNAAGTTIVMVTHSPHDAARARRTVRMIDGRIDGTAAPAA